MTRELSCRRCGSNRLAYPFQLTDEAVIHCGDCGSGIGTIAEVASQVATPKDRSASVER
ncbi:MAG: hypothetical protein JWL74_314 [Alphaproteobacteria bacterium]|jgi:hypothetical protein|nr:hypothetical protein [Alphaproteobacteria bacterium]